MRAHDPRDEGGPQAPAGIRDAADAVVLMTEWNAYRGLDLDQVMARMKGGR